jgi:hypothetical protein
MSDFNKLPTTTIGNIAETWAKEYLESIGYQLYWNTGTQSQPWDGFGYSGSTVKNLIEVKAKYAMANGLVSIHENDLEVYEKDQIDEAKEMIILYVDHKNRALNVTTTKRIRRSTQNRVWDEKEKKWLIYFNDLVKRAELPESIAQEMWNISKKIQYKH